MHRECVCANCYHTSCPPDGTETLYDEVSHEIDNNFISIKIAKDIGTFEPVAENECEYASETDVVCSDPLGRKCKRGCTKVNVMPNQTPPAKKPEEEMLLLRTIRQITPNDDLKNTLEVEFKAPRNYTPLPALGPPPRIIVPKQDIKVAKTVRPKGKNGGKKKK